MNTGRYMATVIDLKPAEGVSGSVKVRSKNVAHLETTKRIAAKIDELFGFRVAFSDLPINRDYIVRSEMHHPPIMQPSGEVISKSVSDMRLKAGTAPLDGAFNSWHFLKGFEHEFVPGKWTRKLYVDAKEVASITVEIEK